MHKIILLLISLSIVGCSQIQMDVAKREFVKEFTTIQPKDVVQVVGTILTK